MFSPTVKPSSGALSAWSWIPVFVCLLLPTGAAAEERASDAQQRWYGYQLLALDGAWVGAGALAVSLSEPRDPGPYLVLGFAGYAFTPSIIHSVHENPGAALPSIGIRLGLPIVGGLVGAALGRAGASCATEFLCGYSEGIEGGIIGFGAGFASASLIDATYLAWTTEAPGQVPARPGRGFITGVSSEISWRPTLAFARVQGNRLTPFVGASGGF